jgi:hypothetical protein
MRIALVLFICGNCFAETMTISQAKQTLMATYTSTTKRTPADIRKAEEALKILAGSAFKHE